MFGKNGLTSSEASHVANFLKEQVKNIDITVDNFQVETSIGIRNGEKYHIDTNVAIPNWKDKLFQKSQFYSLSAWLREGIKAKDNAIVALKSLAFDPSEITGDLLPMPSRPVVPITSFDKFFMTELNTKDQAEYLENQSVAAHIGGFIHNFDTIRAKIQNHVPTSFKNIGAGETMTVITELIYDTETLYSDVEELQSLHREAEKKINYYKAKHKEWEAECLREYELKTSDYARKVSTITASNKAVEQESKSAFEIDKTNNLQQLAQMKIEIPQAFQSLLNEVYEKLK